MKTNITSGKITTEPLVYILVLNWNGMKHLSACLKSLSELKYPNHKIVMIDNASKDGSVEYVKTTFPDVEIIQNKKNLGFCKGNNIGIKYALEQGAAYLVFLNNDTKVEKNWLTELVKTAEKEANIGACSSKIKMFDNTFLINSTGVECSLFGNGLDIGIGRFDDGKKWDRPKEILAVCGAAFFVRADVLKKVGLFPNFDFYLEDIDLSMRIWDLGYKIVYAPSATVYHKFSASMQDEKNKAMKIYFVTRNRFRLIIRNFPYLKFHEFALKLLMAEMRTILHYLKHKFWWRAWIELKALLAVVLFLPQDLIFKFKNVVVKRRKCKFWHFINKERSFSPIIMLPENHEKAGKKYPTNVLMGISDRNIGTGWYSLWDEKGLKYRWFCKKAEVYLSRSKKENILQIQMASPYNYLGMNRIKIYLDGKKIGETDVSFGWDVYHFEIPEEEKAINKLEIQAEKVYDSDITHEICDFSCKVAEISFVNKNDTFFLGKKLVNDNNLCSYIRMGKQEIGLGQGWYEYEKEGDMRWSNGCAEFWLKRGNAGEYILVLEANSLLHEEEQSLRLSIEGHTIEKKLSCGWRKYYIPLSPKIKENQNLETIHILLELNRVVPKEITPGDHRKLGMMVREIRLEGVNK